ncbi:MAG: TIGR04053 family radical SAM/SPASM domain-containing protein [Armatimonadetes bacterium]|nr:TIGR04053 family radical SAM/SPASM domain-containing protein [Armatimonadota bacterium]
MLQIDFNVSPFTVVWEVTRACALHCVHCRAIAQPRRHPKELTLDEGRQLLDTVKEFGNPILVLTGGDPMMRDDLFELIEHAALKLKLRTSLTPSATKMVNRARLQKVKDAGILRVAVSLDGASSEVHDAFRGYTGSFQRTMEILDDLRGLDMSFQLNTTVTQTNVDTLPDIAKLVEASGAVQWSVFFVVPTGRAGIEAMVSPERHEELMHWLAEMSDSAPFDIKSTAAPFYRRVAIQRKQAQEQGPVTFAGAGFRYEDGLHRPVQGVNDGKGFVFISHIGEVYPSGFMPVSAGNVREESLLSIYRESQLFRDLRDPTKLEGKCGRCAFREVCGGRRARAYGVTGNWFASDPVCGYQPAGA